MSAGEKQVDRVKEFSIIDLFFFLGCRIRTAYSEIISEFAGRMPPECQKNPDDI